MGRPGFQHVLDAAGLTQEFPPAVQAEVDAYLAAPGTDDRTICRLGDEVAVRAAAPDAVVIADVAE